MSFVRPRLPQPAQQLYPAPDGLARGRPDGEHSVGGATVSVQESVLSPPRVCRTFPSIGPYPCASDRTAGKPADPNGVFLGGEAGARLSQDLRVPVSPDTMLRLLYRMELAPAVGLRVVGIDEWA